MNEREENLFVGATGYQFILASKYVLDHDLPPSPKDSLHLGALKF